MLYSVSVYHYTCSLNALDSRPRSYNIHMLTLLVLVVDERGSFSAVGAHIFPSFMKTVLEDVDWWWINGILWACGSLFHSSIILLEKNDFRTVVLHLGLNSFCECPLNLCVSKAGWKNLALSTLSFSITTYPSSVSDNKLSVRRWKCCDWIFVVSLTAGFHE